jgi:hypothetical protein
MYNCNIKVNTDELLISKIQHCINCYNVWNCVLLVAWNACGRAWNACGRAWYACGRAWNMGRRVREYGEYMQD